MRVNIESAKGFSDAEKAKLLQSAKLLEQVIATPLFKEMFLEAKFIETKGMSNAQILAKFLSGQETTTVNADGELDLNITMYSKPWSKVIGYTYLNSIATYINSKFFKSFSLSGVAGNIAHEYCHQIGFTHNDKSQWKKTVPYTVGRIVVEIADMLI